MKSIILTICLLIGSYMIGMSQKAREVIEQGVKVKSGHQIFLRYDGSRLDYQTNITPNDVQFIPFEDSILFLPVEQNIVFYIRPLNPLNYSWKSENKITTDPVDEAHATALASIISQLTTVTSDNKVNKIVNKKVKGGKSIQVVEEVSRCQFTDVVSSFNFILERLKKDQHEEVVSTFSTLKGLGFEAEDATKRGLEIAQSKLSAVETYFEKTKEMFSSIHSKVEAIKCEEDKSYEFIVKQVFQLILRDASNVYQEQYKRVGNLQKSFQLVKAASEKASAQGWLTRIEAVPARRGQISEFTININETGYSLSDTKEIVASESKLNATRFMRIRRFQRLVPEVSVGVAHTNLKFPKFVADPDGAGNYVISEAGEETINKLNVTSMINYTFYINNSPIHPFWQLGVGVNADFPTLLTGVGLRLNANGIRRVALAFGFATTWIKSLDQLNPKDTIAAPSELEEDLKYIFNKKPKPYFGIQYNF